MVILGIGVVGITATIVTIAWSAQLIVIDKDLTRLRQIETEFHYGITTVTAILYTISRGVKFADVLVGAVLI